MEINCSKRRELIRYRRDKTEATEGYTLFALCDDGRIARKTVHGPPGHRTTQGWKSYLRIKGTPRERRRKMPLVYPAWVLFCMHPACYPVDSVTGKKIPISEHWYVDVGRVPFPRRLSYHYVVGNKITPSHLELRAVFPTDEDIWDEIIPDNTWR